MKRRSFPWAEVVWFYNVTTLIYFSSKGLLSYINGSYNFSFAGSHWRIPCPSACSWTDRVCKYSAISCCRGRNSPLSQILHTKSLTVEAERLYSVMSLVQIDVGATNKECVILTFWSESVHRLNLYGSVWWLRVKQNSYVVQWVQLPYGRCQLGSVVMLSAY